jgi:hypothetical protein
MCCSRYLRDHEELALIAGGAFGDVYRTRHKLDGIEYAVKKVVTYIHTYVHTYIHSNAVVKPSHVIVLS